MKKLFASILPEQKSRVEGLDLLRAIAILFVVLYHGWAFVSPYFPTLGMLFFLGFWGVEFFFVLSGFLVGGILIRSYQNSSKIDFHFLFNFWKRRWKRTIPIYIIVLICSYLLLNLYFKLGFDFPYLYFIFSQNLWYIHPRFFPEAWSLAVEEWFYISLPILFLVFHLFFKNKTSKNILTIVLISIALFTSTRLLLLNNNFDLIYWDFNVRKIVLYRLDAILYGVLAYQLFTVYTSFFTKYRYLFLVMGLLGLFFSYFFFYQKTNPVFSNVFFLSSTSLSIALCIPFFYNFKCNIRWLKDFITIISITSYSMYLIHYTIIFRIFNTDLVTKNLMHATLILFMYLLTVLISSVFVYRFIEKPVSSR